MRRVLSSCLSACLLASTAVTAAVPSAFESKNFKKEDIITRDVAVVGGGAGGTYSAVAIKDSGKSVILIEKKNRIGGHAETYTDPATGSPIDMGVIVFHKTNIVRDFMARFNIPMGPGVSFFDGLTYYDFRNGKPVQISYNDTDQAAVGAAFAKYSQAREQWPQLLNGTYLPNPVPAELYEPFGKFVAKYGIQAAVPTMYNYNPGVGSDYLKVPTVEVMRYWGAGMSGFDFIAMARRNTSELYGNAQEELLAAQQLLLSSEVTQSERSNKGIKLIVQTPTGKKLILAKKLVIAIPPKTDILAPFDLSSQEKSVFSKYTNGGYWVGIVNNTGFPEDASVTNAIPAGPFNLPPLPASYSFAPSGVKGLQLTTFGTESVPATFPMTEAEVKAAVIATIKTLQKANPTRFVATGEPSFVDFRNHSPYNLIVSAQDIKNGHYARLYKLQGLRNTYYTGAAWIAEDSSRIWKYSREQMLPALLRGL